MSRVVCRALQLYSSRYASTALQLYNALHSTTSAPSLWSVRDEAARDAGGRAAMDTEDATRVTKKAERDAQRAAANRSRKRIARRGLHS